MDNSYHITIKSPIGFIELTSNWQCLLSVSFIEEHNASSEHQPQILIDAAAQLKEYFAGKRKVFNLKLDPLGTEFQKNVWNKVMKIPFGETKTYLDIAIQTGSNKNTRAVGLANGKNPIPIIIPCHRVIGSNGKLTGYAGGIDKKKWLLQNEMQFSNHSNLLF